jgi:ubiquinone/menaquinone biosynthesis C-methylase UbiE
MEKYDLALLNKLPAEIKRYLTNVKPKSLYEHSQLYDLAYRGAKGDIKYYANVSAKGKVLYLGVGTGRIFLPLYERNKEIIGIDKSKKMLQVLKGKNKKLNSTNLLVKDVFKADFKRESFDIVVAPFSFLTQFPEKKVETLLKKILKWLRPNGRFVTDFFSPFSNPLDRNSEIQTIKLGNGIFCKVLYLFDHLNQKLDEYTVLKQGKETFLALLQLNSLYPKQIIDLTTKAGFKSITLTADFTGKPLTTRSKTIVLEARKL